MSLFRYPRAQRSPEVKKKLLVSAIIVGFVAVMFIPAQGTLPLYGNSAAKADNALTIESMLTYAIQDEYLARAEYVAIMAKFGQMPPYSNIKQAEEQHIAWLKDIFASLGLAIPADEAAKYVHVPSTLKEAAQTGVQAEIDNISSMIAFWSNRCSWIRAIAGIADLFTLLRNESSNHLARFRNSCKSIENDRADKSKFEP
jgi:hypothetical protein